MKRNRKPPNEPRTSSPQRKQPQTLGRRRGGRAYRDRHSSTRSPSYIPRSQSLPPLRAGNTQRLARFSPGSAAPGPEDWDTTSASQPVSTKTHLYFISSQQMAEKSQVKVRLHTAVRSAALGFYWVYSLTCIQISLPPLSPNSSFPVLRTITSEKV